MFHVPNQFRVRTHPTLGTNDSAGNNRFFKIDKEGLIINCIASDGYGWEHVSVTLDKPETPSWEIMDFVKNIFWDETDTIIQYHPTKELKVNRHRYCLHLWRPIGVPLPIPHPMLI